MKMIHNLQKLWRQACFLVLVFWGLAAIAQTNVSVGQVAGATHVSEAGTNTPTPLDNTYKLVGGDRVNFRILEDGDEAKSLLVMDSGDLDTPYIGRVHVEGKTCREVAAALKSELEKDYYYQATVVLSVEVMTKNHGRVYLVGAVRAPGPVEVPSDEALTLSKAILRAGGFTDYADRRHVKVTRKEAAGDDKKGFVVDVGEIFDKGKIESDLALEPGDLIYIPDRLIRF